MLVGPWFDNLPHGGGIGQAVVQSAADALLLVAVWQRTSSVWIAVAAMILLATAAYDLALASLVWNPMMGAALAKIATALVLLGWPHRSLIGVVVTSAIAWSAVHCYTGAIFTTLSVFTAIPAGLLFRGDRGGALRSGASIAFVVAALQVPHRYPSTERARRGSGDGRGHGQPRTHRLGSGAARFRSQLGRILRRIHLYPGRALAGRLADMATRRLRDRRDRATSSRPGRAGGDGAAAALGVAGYALYVGDFLDRYYYFSLMPASVLTMVLGLTAFPPRESREPSRIRSS